MRFPIWRRIETNKNTEYYTHKDFTWCIDKIIELIDRFNIKETTMSIEEVKPFLNESVVEIEYALESDRTEPIFIIEYFDNKQILIDGNHRLYRDIFNNLKEIKVYKIPFHIAPAALIEKEMFKDFIYLYRKKSNS